MAAVSDSNLKEQNDIMQVFTMVFLRSTVLRGCDAMSLDTLLLMFQGSMVPSPSAVKQFASWMACLEMLQSYLQLCHLYTSILHHLSENS